MSNARITILGCGSSGGVPRIGGLWGACDPNEPKNHRKRCSILVERDGPDGTTRVVIDTSPDFRTQMLAAGLGVLDGVVYTHAHADHVHGLDDLRMVVINRRERLPVWADQTTADALMARFEYAFVQAPGSTYPPILNLNLIDGPVTVDGSGGPITFDPFEVDHGSIKALGMRIGNIVYLPDVSAMDENGWRMVKDLDIWILDALRYEPHPTHIHFEKSLEWLERAAPKRGILTNMHIDLDWQTIQTKTPDHIDAAYDGMVIPFDLS